MNPPAFQFYADDFLSGTADMTAEEVGVYIRLLCHAWSKDGLDDNERLALLAGQCQASSLAHAKTKFSLVDGKLRNARQEKERAKQVEFRAKQAENGAKRWLGNAKPHALAKPSQMPNACSPISDLRSPIAEREQASADRPSLAEVQFHASSIGLGAWKAEDWFQEMEGCGWLDHQHRPVSAWKAVLARVRTKWEADGRPTAPPTSFLASTKANGTTPERATGSRPEPLWAQIKAVEQLVEGIDKKLARLVMPNPLAYEVGAGARLKRDEEAVKAERSTLIAEKKALNAKLTVLQRQQVEG